MVTVKEVFSGHIGAVIGSEAYKKEYVEKKVANWVKNVEILAEIAHEERQGALSAYNIADGRSCKEQCQISRNNLYHWRRLYETS